jgi:hypothetical protein
MLSVANKPIMVSVVRLNVVMVSVVRLNVVMVSVVVPFLRQRKRLIKSFSNGLSYQMERKQNTSTIDPCNKTFFDVILQNFTKVSEIS